MKTKQEILDEARRHIAESKGFAQVAAPMEDPVRAWARDGEERSAQREAATLARRAEEQRGVQSVDWDGWFIEQLRKHLPGYLLPVVQGMAEFAASSGGMLEELRAQAREREKSLRDTREQMRELKVEVARLNSQIAELNNSERGKTSDLPSWRSSREVN
jgi:hypothetical protein